MKVQKAKIAVEHNWPGTWYVYHDDAKETNAYSVVRQWYGKRQTITHYNDLGSCLQFVTWAETFPKYIIEDMKRATQKGR